MQKHPLLLKMNNYSYVKVVSWRDNNPSHLKRDGINRGGFENLLFRSKVHLPQDNEIKLEYKKIQFCYNSP